MESVWRAASGSEGAKSGARSLVQPLAVAQELGTLWRLWGQRGAAGVQFVKVL